MSSAGKHQRLRCGHAQQAIAAAIMKKARRAKSVACPGAMMASNSHSVSGFRRQTG